MDYQFYWGVIWDYRQALLDGFLMTLSLFFFSAIFSLLFGILVGSMGASKHFILRVPSDFYVEIIRNTPVILKLFILYFGFGLDGFTSAVVGLSLHKSAYMAEIIRAGIQAVPRGQTEAGLSSGLRPLQVLLRIRIPQALVIVIPPLTTQLIDGFKNTSIAMTIALPELTFQAQQIESETFRGFEAVTAATAMYLFSGAVLGGLSVMLERWLAKRSTRVGPQPTTVVLAGV